MCRHRFVLAVCTVLMFSVPAAAQIWNPFAPKSDKTAVAAESPQAQPPRAPTWPMPPQLPTNPLALDKLLQIPGLTPAANRPVNQPSLTQRLHDSAQRFMDDARRAVTPPLLPNRNGAASSSWPLPKAPNFRDLAVVPEFLRPKPPAQPPAPTLSEWIAQERPE